MLQKSEEVMDETVSAFKPSNGAKVPILLLQVMGPGDKSSLLVAFPLAEFFGLCISDVTGGYAQRVMCSGVRTQTISELFPTSQHL